MDTDVMVAAMRSKSGASRVWLNAALTGEHRLLLSVPMVFEYEAVLTRPEVLSAAGTDTQFIGRMLDALCSVCIPVTTTYLWRPMLKDLDDEMVLETAVVGGAQRLLTFNIRDFRGAERFGLQAITPGAALEQLKRDQI